MKKIILILILSISLFSYDKKEDESFVTYELKAEYDDIVFALLDEISNQGFILSYRANIGKNLKNTSEFFKKKPIFKFANKMGFCKSTLSLKMMEENPNNLLFCPLNIGIYELEGKKNEIKIIFSKVKPLRKDEKVMNEVNKIVDSLIKSAILNMR